jgi:hypothetical protein
MKLGELTKLHRKSGGMGHPLIRRYSRVETLMRFLSSSLAQQRRVPHISLVFREMWDTRP